MGIFKYILFLILFFSGRMFAADNPYTGKLSKVQLDQLTATVFSEMYKTGIYSDDYVHAMWVYIENGFLLSGAVDLEQGYPCKVSYDMYLSAVNYTYALFNNVFPDQSTKEQIVFYGILARSGFDLGMVGEARGENFAKWDRYTLTLLYAFLALLCGIGIFNIYRWRFWSGT
jgi:hypothetical protein